MWPRGRNGCTLPSPLSLQVRRRSAERSCRALLLGLNQSVRLVRFATDGDGDVSLLADLPKADLSFTLFAATMDALIHYTRELAAPLGRTATDPRFEMSFP